jgi:glycosyltransferase involved in cell wall biosynthesis
VTNSATRRPTRYAVIPTHNRPDHLTELVSQLGTSCDDVVIVDNASDPPVDLQRLLVESLARSTIHIIRDEEQPPNLARFWNIAFAWIEARECESESWDVAVLNDDAKLPTGWYDYVAKALRSYDVVAASADAYGHVKTPLVRHRPDNDLITRMCPWAFVFRGETRPRADENLRWWWQDTDLEWRFRLAGGTVMMPGYVVKNVGANSSTHGELAEQAARDRRAFAAKWGHNPW